MRGEHKNTLLTQSEDCTSKEIFGMDGKLDMQIASMSIPNRPTIKRYLTNVPLHVPSREMKALLVFQVFPAAEH